MRQRRQESERLALEKLNSELADARFKAEAGSRSKSQFLANMSHELRTPFNGLMGMMQMLSATQLDAHQKDYVATAQSSAQHLLGLLNDILDVAALESGNLKLSTGPIALRQVFKDVQALMAPQAQTKGLEFVGVSDQDVLPWADIDAKRLKQILFNLVGNAIKFTESGSITLTVNISALGGDRADLMCEIIDTGIGMDTPAMERLFQRFYQVDGAHTRKYGGTGLGLEISQSLATLMNGKISVRSTVAQGSTFTLRVPINVCHSGAQAFPTSSALSAPTAVTKLVNAGAPASKVRVLVVEDHPINRKLVGMLLTRMGCDISFCEDGQAAVDLVRTQPFDAILMDVNMPVMDGMEATRRLRVQERFDRLPIIAMTAGALMGDRERCLSVGMNDYTYKDEHDVSHTIEGFLETYYPDKYYCSSYDIRDQCGNSRHCKR